MLEVRPHALLWFGAAAQRLCECVTPVPQSAPTNIQCVVTAQLNERAPAKRVSTAVPDVENEGLAVPTLQFLQSGSGALTQLRRRRPFTEDRPHYARSWHRENRQGSRGPSTSPLGRDGVPGLCASCKGRTGAGCATVPRFARTRWANPPC
jgi:hypothetical protein